MADAEKARAAIAAAIRLGSEMIAAAMAGDFDAAAQLHAERDGHLRAADAAFGPGEDAAWREAISAGDDHDVRWLTDAVVRLGTGTLFAEMLAASAAVESRPEHTRRAFLGQRHADLHLAKRETAAAIGARKKALELAEREATSATEQASRI